MFTAKEQPQKADVTTPKANSTSLDDALLIAMASVAPGGFMVYLPPEVFTPTVVDLNLPERPKNKD